LDLIALLGHSFVLSLIVLILYVARNIFHPTALIWEACVDQDFFIYQHVGSRSSTLYTLILQISVCILWAEKPIFRKQGNLL